MVNTGLPFLVWRPCVGLDFARSMVQLSHVKLRRCGWLVTALGRRTVDPALKKLIPTVMPAPIVKRSLRARS